MDIRPYEPRDRDACLAIFDSLTPAFLDTSARPHFEAWLDDPSGPFFVLEHDDVRVGCGGYTVDATEATLHWGMVRADCQGKGIGRFLLMYRVREIGRTGNVAMILAHSPAPSVGFFEKQGFRANGISIPSSLPGTPLTRLSKKLTVCP
jgi:GNAT superfamily N-acetyltransferase